MIWFSCKQCGKTHSRPESAVGATIFCACGAGLIVPWESTATEPAAPPPVPDAGPPLQLEPVTFDVEPEPQRLPPARSRKRARMGPRDPSICFNHDEAPRHAACADCGESFCGACLVTFAGAPLCGPCKNYRIKNLQRVLPPSNLSILSMLVAFLAGPVALCLLPLGQVGFPWWSLIALLPQGLAGALAFLALRQAEKDPQVAGRSLALTSLLTVAVTTAMIVLLTLYTPQLWT